MRSCEGGCTVIAWGRRRQWELLWLLTALHAQKRSDHAPVCTIISYLWKQDKSRLSGIHHWHTTTRWWCSLTLNEWRPRPLSCPGLNSLLSRSLTVSSTYQSFLQICWHAHKTLLCLKLGKSKGQTSSPPPGGDRFKPALTRSKLHNPYDKVQVIIGSFPWNVDPTYLGHRQIFSTRLWVCLYRKLILPGILL